MTGRRPRNSSVGAWPIRSRPRRANTGAMADDLTNIPNVGPEGRRALRRLGIETPDDLQGRGRRGAVRAPVRAWTASREDPCLLDTFTAAVDFANGAPARPWWEYSRERLARESAHAGATQPT